MSLHLKLLGTHLVGCHFEFSFTKRSAITDVGLASARYCRRGKHRSVAAACILRHIFQCEGYHCPELQSGCLVSTRRKRKRRLAWR